MFSIIITTIHKLKFHFLYSVHMFSVFVDKAVDNRFFVVICIFWVIRSSTKWPKCALSTVVVVDNLLKYDIRIEANTIWDSTLSALEKSLNKPIYETILSSTRPITLEDGFFFSQFQIHFPNWLYDKKCDTSILTLSRTWRRAVRTVKLSSSQRRSWRRRKDRRSEPISASKVSVPFLNPRYTFDNFWSAMVTVCACRGSAVSELRESL